MTDAQIITDLAAMGRTLFNNSRIGDVKEVVRAELKARNASIR